MEKILEITSKMLTVFLDETGIEDFSDPNFPIFGRGGCAVIGKYIEKPWRQLKRFRLGGANKPFHASEFAQLPPTKAQIYAINQFFKGNFYRFFNATHATTNIPQGIDGHKTVAISLISCIYDIAKNLDIDKIALIFEESKRGDPLVERDFDLNNIEIFNKHNQRLEVDGYFLDKESMTAGLEVADLIVHTVGRQARIIYNKPGDGRFNRDYQEVFHHDIEIGLADGIFVSSIQVT